LLRIVWNRVDLESFGFFWGFRKASSQVRRFAHRSGRRSPATEVAPSGPPEHYGLASRRKACSLTRFPRPCGVIASYAFWKVLPRRAACRKQSSATMGRSFVARRSIGGRIGAVPPPVHSAGQADSERLRRTPQGSSPRRMSERETSSGHSTTRRSAFTDRATRPMRWNRPFA
jgi:hypothetical protein